MSEYEIWQASESAHDSQFLISDHTHLCNVLGWVKSALDGIEENTIQQCFIKTNCLPVMSNVISSQDIDWFAPSSSQAINGLLEILQEIWLDVSFSASLGIDDATIDQVAKDLIEMDAFDATGNDNVDDVNIVKSVLEQHNLLQSASNSDDDEDVVEIPPVVTVKQANQAITDLINFLSLESSLPMELQSDLLSNLQRACCPLIHQQKFEKVGLLKQLTVAKYFTAVQKEWTVEIGA